MLSTDLPISGPYAQNPGAVIGDVARERKLSAARRDRGASAGDGAYRSRRRICGSGCQTSRNGAR